MAIKDAGRVKTLSNSSAPVKGREAISPKVAQQRFDVEALKSSLQQAEKASRIRLTTRDFALYSSIIVG